jgi:hypothetical protein
MFRKSDISKNLFRVFLRSWVRQRISSGIRPKFDIKSNIFFCLKEREKLQRLAEPFFEQGFGIIKLKGTFIFRVPFFENFSSD